MRAKRTALSLLLVLSILCGLLQGWVVPVKGAITQYNVWVGNIQVNDENKDDVLKDGKVQFTPGNPNTLTIQPGANISKSINISSYKTNDDPAGSYAHIYSQEDLIIIFAGNENTISYKDPFLAFVEGTLTVKASGKVIANYNGDTIGHCFYGRNGINVEGNFEINCNCSAIRSYGDVTLAGKITIHTVDWGIFSKNGSVTINGPSDGSSSADEYLVNISAMPFGVFNTGVAQGRTGIEAKGNVTVNAPLTIQCESTGIYSKTGSVYINQETEINSTGTCIGPLSDSSDYKDPLRGKYGIYGKTIEIGINCPSLKVKIPSGNGVDKNALHSTDDNGIILDDSLMIRIPTNSSISEGESGSDVYDEDQKKAAETVEINKRNPYTVTFDSNGGSGTMDPETVLEGNQYTVPDCGFKAPEHKEFSHWLIEGTEQTIDPKNDEANKIEAGNYTLVAVWKDLPKYTITVSTNSTEGTVSISGQESSTGTYYKGEEVTVSATANKGFKFEGWYEEDNKVSSDNPYTFDVSDAGRTLTAKFSAIPQLTYIWLNGDESELDRKTIYEGEQVPTTDKEPTKAETEEYTYSFAGWDDGTTVGSITTFKPIFLEVKKPPKPTIYTIIWLNGDNTELDRTTFEAGQEEPKTDKVPTKAEDENYTYVFSYWESSEQDKTIIKKPVFASIQKPKEPVTYTIIWLNGDGSQLDTAEYQKVDEKTPEPTTAKVPTKAEDEQYIYVFQDWDAGTVNGTTKTYKPVFDHQIKKADGTVADSIKVSFFTDGGSEVASQTIEKGGTATQPINPTKEGYSFIGWFTDTTYAVPFIFSKTLTENTVIYARWQQNTEPVNITYTVSEGGNGRYTKGSKTNMTIRITRSYADNECFQHFVGVQIDGVTLLRELEYTAVSGSTVVTLKADLLEKLTNAIHTVSFIFDDGKVETALTVTAQEESQNSNNSNNNNSSNTTPSGSGSNNPATGDSTSASLWIGFMTVALMSAICLSLILRRRNHRNEF